MINISIRSHCEFKICYFTTLMDYLEMISKIMITLTIKSNENGSIHCVRVFSCAQNKNWFFIRFTFIMITWASKWTIVLKLQHYLKKQKCWGRTWHGQRAKVISKISRQFCRQAWSSLQSTTHWPRLILFLSWQVAKFLAFCGEPFPPQTQIGFMHPLQPFGQCSAHGQSRD